MSISRDTSRLSAFSDIDDDDTARIGLISGLSARQDLNGKEGRAVRWVQKKQRWAVIMVESNEKVLVRDECIQFVDDEADPAVGLPVAAASLLAAPEPVPTPAKAGETGSPGHPVEGTRVEGSVKAADETPPVVQWLFDAARCFCLPVGGEAKPAIMATAPMAAA